MKKQRQINTAMNVNEKRNKTILIVIVVVIAIILLLCGVFATLFFTTDLFKSDKKLFFKYAMNLESRESKNEKNNLIKYFEKKNTTPYSNSGSISANINDPSASEEAQGTDYNISFSGKTDKSKSLAEQEVDLNYNDNIKLPIKYKHVEDIYGLQTDDVGMKYISIDINKLGELLGYPDLDIKSILNNLKNIQDKFKFTDEEEKGIKEYGKLLENELNDEKFSKTDDGSYKLTLSQQDITNIQIKILEKLKGDNVILNKINQIAGEFGEDKKITPENIDECIQDINENEESRENNIVYEIIVHANNGETDNVSISAKDDEENQIKYNLNIESSDDSLKYNNTFTQTSGNNNTEFTFNINLNGLSKVEAVNEDYTLGVRIDFNGKKFGEANYTYNNNIYFDDSITIEPFSDENKLMLTDMGADEIQSFLTAVGERMAQVDQQLKQQAGITSDLSITSPFLSAAALATGIQAYNQATAVIDEGNMNEVAKATFNSKFTQYEGSDVRGVQVKSLIQQVLASNTNGENEDNQIKITGVITLEGTDFIEGDSSVIKSSSKYSVTISKYNDNGLVSEITIEEE